CSAAARSRRSTSSSTATRSRDCRSFATTSAGATRRTASRSRSPVPGRRTHLQAMPEQTEEITLLETLDHLLDRGVVIAGEATISIGDVDLLYLGLNIVLANMDAMKRSGHK